MGILDKLLRRKGTHEQWLEAHPGKGHFNMDAAITTDAEQAATRSRMEAELDKQNNRQPSE